LLIIISPAGGDAKSNFQLAKLKEVVEDTMAFYNKEIDNFYAKLPSNKEIKRYL